MASENNQAVKVADTSDNSGFDYETTEADSVIESKLLRKIDLRLLPPVSVLYLLSFLDRSNVANARIEGLTTDLHMTGNQYLTGLTLYFIGYVVIEIPCSIILRRTSPKFWLPTLTLAWGVVATLMGLAQNLTGFFLARFFLGIAESGLFPGVVYYFSMWYKRNERQYRISLFFSCASLAGAFGGICAWGIAHMRNVGGYHGWRWIFILEGLLTIVIAIMAYWFISNYPNSVSWLSEKERHFIQDRLKADSDATHFEQFRWSDVWSACKDVKCWLYGFGYYTMSLPLYTLSLFLPTIIKDMGYTSAQSQLLSIPPYAFATMFTVVWAVLSENFHRRAAFIMTTTSLAILGYIILLTNENPSKKPGVSYAGTFFAAAGIYPSVALVLSWPAINVSGQTKRAVANGLQVTIGNFGAILGTQLYRPKTAPRYILGHSFALGYLCMNLVVVGVLWLILARENRKKREYLINHPETPGFHDSEEDLKQGDQHPRWVFNV